MSYRYRIDDLNNREDHYLNNIIEQYIEQWYGTCKGSDVKNMYENGTSYEVICEYIGADYDELA